MGVLKHELVEMLPPTIFFFVVFHLVAFARALLDAQYGISVVSTAAATIGALVVGKAILLADGLPVMHWFRDRRLIYNVLWRIGVYVVLVLLLQCLEELIPLLFRGAGIVAGSEQFVRGNRLAKILGHACGAGGISGLLLSGHGGYRCFRSRQDPGGIPRPGRGAWRRRGRTGGERDATAPALIAGSCLGAIRVRRHSLPRRSANALAAVHRIAQPSISKPMAATQLPATLTTTRVHGRRSETTRAEARETRTKSAAAIPARPTSPGPP